MSLPRILVLHGPSLNMLGTREPAMYGSMSLVEIDDLIRAHAKSRAEIVARQSNHEGDLIDWILTSEGSCFAAIVLNPGAYAHTSYAIFDAVRATATPVVEVHMSNVYAREAFRKELVVAPAARGVISGFGPQSYLLGLDAALTLVSMRS